MTPREPTITRIMAYVILAALTIMGLMEVLNGIAVLALGRAVFG